MINIGSRLCLLVAGVTIVAGSVFAQAPGKPEPTPAPPLNSAPGEDLSEKLNRSNGVIHPKEVDPTIEKPAPKTGDPERGAAARDFRRRSRARQNEGRFDDLRSGPAAGGPQRPAGGLLPSPAILGV